MLLGSRYGEVMISIHAPREGCDEDIQSDDLVIRISIHAPREGCDSVMASL